MRFQFEMQNLFFLLLKGFEDTTDLLVLLKNLTQKDLKRIFKNDTVN